MPLGRNSRNHGDDAKSFSRELRRNQSVSEQVLWLQLRKQKQGFKFKRQVPLANYVLDFYCPEAKLCVEVDGEQHEMRRDRDEIRDSVLANLGITTIRIPSLDLFDQSPAIDRWLKQVYVLCCERTGRKPQRG